MLDRPELSSDETRRYMRQLVIQPLGDRGQLLLKAGRVLVVGAGGLGSPVIAYLAAAGVGTIGIVDNDEITISNLNRQILYRTSDLGRSKAECAREFAEALNDHLVAVPHVLRVDQRSALELIGSHDVVVDGSDNILTRRAVAAAALRLRKPLVCGAIGQLEGHVSVFIPIGVGVPAGFNHVYPDVDTELPSCEAVGTFGAVAGVIGSLMAMETIKLIAGLGESLAGRVIHYDALRSKFTERSLETAPRLRYLVGG